MSKFKQSKIRSFQAPVPETPISMVVYRPQFVIDGPLGTLYEKASVEEIKA